MDTLDRTFVFLLDPCSLVFGSCTQPLTRLAGGSVLSAVPENCEVLTSL